MTGTFLDNIINRASKDVSVLLFFLAPRAPHAHSYLVVLVSANGDHRSARTIDKRGQIPNAAESKNNNTVEYRRLRYCEY